MKREADNQLTKDDFAEGVPQEEQPAIAFKRADEAALAARTIRPLPRSRLAGAAAAPPPLVNSEASNVKNDAVPPSTTKFGGFGGFGGFGSGSASTHAFSFTAPGAAPVSSAMTSTSSTPSTSSMSSPFLFTPTTPVPALPSISDTASGAAKTFASFLGTPSSSAFASPSGTTSFEQPKEAAPQKPPFTLNAPTSTPPAVAPTREENVDADPSAIKYYKSLRGLNMSFLVAVSTALEADPFANVTNLMEQYRKLRLDVQKEFDDAPKAPSLPLQTEAVPAPAPAPAAPPTKSTLSMPAAPTSFSGFPAPSPNNSNVKAPPAGGFTPTLPNPASGSSLFSFSPSTTSTATTTPPTLTGFSFSTPPPKPAAEGSSAFGGLSSTSSTFSFKSSSDSITEEQGTSKSSNGILSTTTPSLPASSTSSSSFFNKTETPKPSSGDPPKLGMFGSFSGFGKPPSSIGTSSTSASTDFKFSAPPSSIFQPQGNGQGEEGEGDKGEQVNAGSAENKEGQTAAMLFSHSPHDDEGEGEEEEVTTHSVKVKAYRWRKEDEGGAGWAELGTGVLRLKKHKEGDKRRVLLRNSASGKININFNIYQGLKPSITKKAVTFIGHDAGVSRTYSVRTANETLAQELKNALDREIRAVVVDA